MKVTVTLLPASAVSVVTPALAVDSTLLTKLPAAVLATATPGATVSIAMVFSTAFTVGLPAASTSVTDSTLPVP